MTGCREPAQGVRICLLGLAITMFLAGCTVPVVVRKQPDRAYSSMMIFEWQSPALPEVGEMRAATAMVNWRSTGRWYRFLALARRDGEAFEEATEEATEDSPEDPPENLEQVEETEEAHQTEETEENKELPVPILMEEIASAHFCPASGVQFVNPYPSDEEEQVEGDVLPPTGFFGSDGEKVGEESVPVFTFYNRKTGQISRVRIAYLVCATGSVAELKGIAGELPKAQDFVPEEDAPSHSIHKSDPVLGPLQSW